MFTSGVPARHFCQIRETFQLAFDTSMFQTSSSEALHITTIEFLEFRDAGYSRDKATGYEVSSNATFPLYSQVRL